MNKIKVMTVFGTRPEAIKMAPLVPRARAEKTLNHCVCYRAAP